MACGYQRWIPSPGRHPVALVDEVHPGGHGAGGEAPRNSLQRLAPRPSRHRAADRQQQLNAVSRRVVQVEGDDCAEAVPHDQQVALRQLLEATRPHRSAHLWFARYRWISGIRLMRNRVTHSLGKKSWGSSAGW